MYAYLSVAIYWLFSLGLYFMGYDDDALADRVNIVDKQQVLLSVASQHALQVFLQVCFGTLFVESDIFTLEYVLYSYLGYATVEYIAHYCDHYWYNSWFWGKTHRQHHDIIHPWAFAAVYVSWPSAIRGSIFHMIVQIYILGIPYREHAIAQSLVYIFAIAFHCDAFYNDYHRAHHERLKGNYSNIPPVILDILFGTELVDIRTMNT